MSALVRTTQSTRRCGARSDNRLRPAGEVTVHVAAAGHLTVEKLVSVFAGKPTHLQVTLKKDTLVAGMPRMALIVLLGTGQSGPAGGATCPAGVVCHVWGLVPWRHGTWASQSGGRCLPIQLRCHI